MTIEHAADAVDTHDPTAPVYDQGGITVYAGDVVEVLARLPDASVDAVVTDPPYNLTANKRGGTGPATVNLNSPAGRSRIGTGNGGGGFMGLGWDGLGGREDAGFAYWLTGLIDGEGHFGIKRHSRGSHAPFFSLKLRDDDEAVLKQAQRQLGIGSITYENRGDKNGMARWVVQDKAGCVRLVELLDKYRLRAKKSHDYAVWREAVCEWAERGRGNRWHGPADDTRMAALKRRLESGRAYVDPAWSGNEFQDWCRLWATEVLRVLKPGGHLLAFGGSRTGHRLACGIEDAGFEIRDSIAWCFGSGFPKSLDVSKGIDAAAGADREVVGTAWMRDIRNGHGRGYGDGFNAGAREAPEYLEHAYTAPATEDAKAWDGWGTALKPAHEPIVVARKPLAGTVVATVLAHGTGALNIGGCRIPHAGASDLAASQAKNPGRDDSYTGEVYGAGRPQQSVNEGGRWPANVVLDVDQADQLDAQSGDQPARGNRNPTGGGGGMYGHPATEVDHGPGDSGGASRYFLRIAETVDTLPARFRYTTKAGQDERVKVNGVSHPTVKPIELMRWLVRLVTPPGGTVCDPFAGSGTTVEACILEGFGCVAVERDPDYLPLIRQRIDRRRDPVAAVRNTKREGDDDSLFDLLGGDS